MNKYHAKKTLVDGITFDSKREAARWKELRLLAQAGQIGGLTRQIRYDFVVNDVKIGRYTADFVYYENGNKIVEDVKSPATKKARDYVLRKKLMLALFGIVIRET